VSLAFLLAKKNEANGLMYELPKKKKEEGARGRRRVVDMSVCLVVTLSDPRCWAANSSVCGWLAKKTK
jgi:hypothetical protein